MNVDVVSPPIITWPRGAYISAPRFGIGGGSLFVRMDPGKMPMMNGKEIMKPENKDEIHEITIGSKGPKEFDFSSFSGKIRVLGSTILHLLSPVLLSSIEAAVVQKCYVWDIAASHAVIKALGMDAEDTKGNRFVYTDDFIFGKEQLKDYLYAGTDEGRKELRRMLPPLGQNNL